MTDFDAEARDALRDLCLAVATLAARAAHLIGTDAAGEIVAHAGRLSNRLDALDVADRLGDDE